LFRRIGCGGQCGCDEVFRLFVMTITDRIIRSYSVVVAEWPLTAEAMMKFKTNSTPITADTTENARIERISQPFRPDPASELMTRDTIRRMERCFVAVAQVIQRNSNFK
jgi:hypothetical protein